MDVLLVDDDALIRDSLKMLLELEEDVGDVRTAIHGAEAVEICREWLPDIVLMDIRMPEMDGVTGTKTLKVEHPQLPVVILTTFKDDEYIREAVRYGAAGYLLKNLPAERIIASLRWVLEGNAVFPQDVALSLGQMLPETGTSSSSAPWDLTEREWEIAQLVAEGLSNKEMAAKLFLSEGTVRNYVTTLLDKLELRDRTQLAIAVLKHNRQ